MGEVPSRFNTDSVGPAHTHVSPFTTVWSGDDGTDGDLKLVVARTLYPTPTTPTEPYPDVHEGPRLSDLRYLTYDFRLFKGPSFTAQGPFWGGS